MSTSAGHNVVYVICLWEMYVSMLVLAFSSQQVCVSVQSASWLGGGRSSQRSRIFPSEMWWSRSSRATFRPKLILIQSVQVKRDAHKHIMCNNTHTDQVISCKCRGEEQHWPCDPVTWEQGGNLKVKEFSQNVQAPFCVDRSEQTEEKWRLRQGEC